MAERKSIEERFWSKVDFFGPTPEHVPGIGNCWVWMASKDGCGYGMIGFMGSMPRAHRLSWIMANGAIPPETPCVRHRCDNPSCVRPDHLFVDTKAGNNRDMLAKRRHRSPDAEMHSATMVRVAARGERHSSRTHPERVPRGDRHGRRTQPQSRPRGEANGLSKLTADQVREIRRMSAGGRQGKVIARDFKISESAVSDIIRRKTWAHVGD